MVATDAGSSSSSSSDEEDAALQAALASVAVSFHDVQSEHNKAAAQGQQRLGKARDSTAARAAPAASDAHAQAEGQQHESDNEGNEDDKKPQVLGIVEQRIAQALNKRLERLLSQFFTSTVTDLATGGGSGEDDGAAKKTKKRKQKAVNTEAAATSGDQDGHAGLQGGVSGTAAEVKSCDGAQPQDLGCGVRLFKKVVEGQPVVSPPKGSSPYEAGWVPTNMPPRSVQLHNSLMLQRARQEQNLLTQWFSGASLQLPTSRTVAAQQAALNPGMPQGVAGLQLSGREDVEAAVKKQVKQLMKVAEKAERVIAKGMKDCAVGGDEVAAQAVVLGYKNATDLEMAMGALAQHLGQTWVSGESASKQVRKRQRAKAHVRHVKHEGEVVEAKTCVPYEVRTAKLLGVQ